MNKTLFSLLLCFIALTPFAWTAGNASDYIAAGNRFATEKKYSEAIQQYELALKADPKIHQVNLMIGLSYANIGDLDNALTYTRIAAEKNPSYTTQYNLGLIYGARKETERSIKAFDEALSFNPKSSSAEYQKGLVFSEANAYEKAAESFERALKLNPRLDEARVGLIGSYLKLDNRAGALDQIEEFRKMKKDNFAAILEARIKEADKTP